MASFEALADNIDEDEGTTEDSIVNAKSDSDMVPFHCLLSQEQRERLVKAINLAKTKHGLETVSEALDVIAQEYLR